MAERTLGDLKGELAIGVIEGDRATLNDAQPPRRRHAGARPAPARPGARLGGADRERRQPRRPALFDLGERAKVVILSVTEGEDKPIKYPHMFRASMPMLLDKIDLLPHLRFDVERCIGYARQVNPDIEGLRVSAEPGAGMPAWYARPRSHLGVPQSP